MEDVLDGLNPAQRAAVTSQANVLQVLAPPGSGKTKTLTARVAYLISHHVLEPQNIIVCTFTVKAAREMQDRISGFLGQQTASRLMLGTFHSIARRFLAVYGTKIGLHEKFSIADSSDTLGILIRIVKRGKFGIDAKAARSRISSLKSQSILPEQFKVSLKKADQQEIAMIYQDYEDHLALSNLLDFDDLLLRCCHLLRRYPSCVSNIQAVLIDEFQDTNNVQYDLMSLFSQATEKITVVGDPDQSIYGWRNAEILNLKKMQNQFPDTQVAKLEENYRSSGAILLSAQEVIEQDQSRPSKRLMPTHSVGMRPVLRRLPTAAIEAMWILSEIKRTSALTGGLLRWSDYSILLRSAALSRHIESVLGKAGVPYRMVGGHKFFDRLEVKLVLDYIRVIHHPGNSDALARILNVPSRKIGDATIQRMLEQANEQELTLWSVVLGLAQGTLKSSINVSPQSQKGLEAFVNIILTSQRKIREAIEDNWSLSDLLEFVLKKANIEDHLRRSRVEDFDARWANVQELVTQAADVASELRMTAVATEGMSEFNELQLQESSSAVTIEDTLDHFLTNVALSADMQKNTEAEQSTDQVTISTIHAAKGLEWPVVFIPAAYDGSIPHSRAEDHDEERRLLYVAMTRAQSLLYLSCPFEESCKKETKLSPFLSQKPMESYFDKCGADLGPTVSTEIASILRRPQPEQALIEQAMMSIRHLKDDQWPWRAEGSEDDDNYGVGEHGDQSPGRSRFFSDGKRGASINAMSISTSMQQQANYSISSTTFSTSFMKASTAMDTLQKDDQAVVNRIPEKAPNKLPQKRKLGGRDDAGTAKGTLTKYFSGQVSNASKPDERQTKDSMVEVQANMSPAALQDITNKQFSDSQGWSVTSSKTSAVAKPATTFHATSLSQLRQAGTKKTLGMRRSINGWSAQEANTSSASGSSKR